MNRSGCLIWTVLLSILGLYLLGSAVVAGVKVIIAVLTAILPFVVWTVVILLVLTALGAILSRL